MSDPVEAASKSSVIHTEQLTFKYPSEDVHPCTQGAARMGRFLQYIKGAVMMEATRFVILKEDHGDFVPFGRVGKPLTLAEVKIELARLAAQYPDQTFHLFGDCGAAIHHDAISN